MKPPFKRPYRLVDGMILVAATAVAFAIFRKGLAPGLSFNTFGGSLEQWAFYWMHQVVPFPAMWSLAIVAIAAFDRRTPNRRKLRHAGIAGCFAAVAVLALTTVIASTFYGLHALEELQMIPRIFSHGRNSHATPPFANAPMEEIVGSAVIGTWALLAVGGRWKAERSWLDRSGRFLSVMWIVLFLTYLYAYTG
jgi:hypothetical protein